MGSAFSPVFQKKMTSTLQQLQVTAKENVPKGIIDKIESLNLPTIIGVDTSVNKRAATTVSSSLNEYVIDDRHYVLIEGKYYPAREDNIYMVNGQKMFYVNNDRYEKDPADETRWRQARNEEIKNDSEALKIPTSPDEMVKILNRAQQKMKERAQALEETK